MNKELKEALIELVELKDLKDKYGRTAGYLERQPIAWNNARKALKESKI